jgi:hypothetical protein
MNIIQAATEGIGPSDPVYDSIISNRPNETLHVRRRDTKRNRESDSDCDCLMDSPLITQDVVRVARRVYVGNLAWKTSWQDLKVRSQPS